MRARVLHVSCWLIGAVMLVGAMGCETSSRKSLRTYDYNDQGQAPQKEPKEELNSEYQMVSPGEMVVEP